LRWAVNNVSTIHGNETVISKAVHTSRLLGWPQPIADTVEIPSNPPFTWDYGTPVLDPGGPGKGLGVLSEAVMSLEEGEVVEFVLQNSRAINGVAEYHPWHAHGYSFWVVGQGQGIYDPATDVASYNLENPVLRDTVSLQPLSWVAIRFLVDNPGTWLFHCHILSHQIMGMGFVMVVQPNLIDDVPLAASVEFCSAHDEEAPASQPVSGAYSRVVSLWALFPVVLLWMVALVLERRYL
jgi:laccase